MRQIVLDTETTGLETAQGNRIIEIGCVEIIDRRLTNNNYHQYINPQRDSEEGALQVHGLDTEFLNDKPLFEHIVDDFIAYIRGAELIIHNAPFDIGFLDYELSLLDRNYPKINQLCDVVDSLALARHKHPGQSNKLDALCKRYGIDNSHRSLHGALLDSEILADVYLAMTGGQGKLMLSDTDVEQGASVHENIIRVNSARSPLAVVKATTAELAAHQHLVEKFNLN